MNELQVNTESLYQEAEKTVESIRKLNRYWSDREILSIKWADTGTVKVMKPLQKTIWNFQINSHSC